MSSKLDKELDDLMVKVDSKNSKNSKEEKEVQSKDEPKEEPKQEPDTSKDVESDMDSEKESEPEKQSEPAPEGEEDLGLNTDKIDYPEEDEEEQEMDAEAKKLPDIDDIYYGGYDDDDSKVESDEETVDNNEDKLSKTLLKLKKNSMSGKVEAVMSPFKEKYPDHEICCVTSDKVISILNGKAHETVYKKDGSEIEFNQPIRNKELEEQKASNDAIIEKLLNFDNILTDIK